MDTKFSYRNEDDKSYGATGMAVAVMIFDCEDKLAYIDLDETPDSMFHLTGDFYFAGNPGVSAKTAWNQILSNFNLTMAMTIANVMCRRVVLDRLTMEEETRNALLDLLKEVGADSCQLEDDETLRLFNKNYTYLHRVFNHYGVQSVVNDFADELKRCRRMTRYDVIDHLRALSSL